MVNDNLPNTPNARPAENRSQAYEGTPPDQVLAQWARKLQPLPAPIGEPPYHCNLETSLPGIGELAATAGKIVFHAVGDTGAYLTGEYLAGVVKAMEADLAKTEAERPAFFYHLGDVVYPHGRHEDYYEQFYKPYQQYTAPIFSIPGNHDADIKEISQQSLDGWCAFFMTKTPHIDPISNDAPRQTLALPNVYYTLNCPYVTIIGLYTNVPEHGVIDESQHQWFINELRTAPKDKALIVCMHNPVYSFDSQHSGSPIMGAILETAINQSRRVPNMLLTAHVHNYQRIEKEMIQHQPTPVIVAGNGGYYLLHHVVSPEGSFDELTGAKLIKAYDKSHGYMELTVDAQNIYGRVVTVDETTGKAADFDSFKYSAEAKLLEDGEMVKL